MEEPSDRSDREPRQASDPPVEDVGGAGGAAFDEPSRDGEGERDKNDVGAAAPGDEDSAARKWRRGRRNRKAGEHHQSSGGRKQWKPYTKMTWEERREADERVTMKAQRRRDQRQAAGQAMAPYNTTQFLMEQHEPPVGAAGDVQPPFLCSDVDASGANRSSGSLTGDSSVADLDDNVEVLFLENQFAEEYESFQAERLQTLTKDELIREYVELVKKLERLQESRSTGQGDDTVTEVKRLTAENARLSKENEQLRLQLAALQKMSSETSPAAADGER